MQHALQTGASCSGHAITQISIQVPSVSAIIGPASMMVTCKSGCPNISMVVHQTSGLDSNISETHGASPPSLFCQGCMHTEVHVSAPVTCL